EENECRGKMFAEPAFAIEQEIVDGIVAQFGCEQGVRKTVVKKLECLRDYGFVGDKVATPAQCHFSAAWIESGRQRERPLALQLRQVHIESIVECRRHSVAQQLAHG